MHETQYSKLTAFLAPAMFLLFVFYSASLFAFKLLSIQPAWIGGLVSVLPVIVVVIAQGWAVSRSNGTVRRFWLILMVSFVIYLGANLLWAVYDELPLLVLGYPVYDGLFKIHWLLVVGSILVLVWDQANPYRFVRVVLDMLLGIVVGATFLWYVAINQLSLGGVHLSPGDLLATISYPVGGAGILLLLTSVYYDPRHLIPTRVWSFLMAGFALEFLADVKYFASQIGEVSFSNEYLTTLWGASALMWALAAISYGLTPEDTDTEHKWPDSVIIRSILAYVASWLVFGLLVMEARTLNLVVVAVGLTLLCVVVRQMFSLKENQVLGHRLAKTNDSLAEKVNELEYLAYYDPLTNLANRHYLDRRLSEIIATTSTQVGVLSVDIDRFKNINDTYGHAFGDKLLQEVANRIGQLEADVVARTNVDGFIIVYDNVSFVTQITLQAQRLRDALLEPFRIEGVETLVTISIGITVFPADGETAERLLRNADIAMHKAKEVGRNNFQFYSASMTQSLEKRLSVETALRGALQRGELQIHYQPQINVEENHGKLVGVEALLRWQHPALGQVSPAEFIPIAEDTGLIVSLGNWVLWEACKQLREWHDRGYSNMRMAVNLSARQFEQGDIVQLIAQNLKEFNLEPEYLELELTERIALENEHSVLDSLSKLKRLGVRIAIDDFGTGYSALAYLRKFPVDSIKIAQQFSQGLELGTNDDWIVRAIVTLGKSLGLNVVAEGVETKEQLEFFKGLGCYDIQGFYFAKPMPAQEVPTFLDSVVP